MTLSITEQGRKRPKAFRILLWVIVITGTPLILTSILAQSPNRLLATVWNLGHIPFFFALTWLIIDKIDSEKGTIHQLILVNLSMIVLGIFIEGIQSQIGREFSIGDIYLNCLGSSLAVVFHRSRNPSGLIFLTTLKGIGIVLVGISLVPFFRNTIDTIQGHNSFPVLSNFESTFELSRWVGHDMTIEQNSISRNHVLSKIFATEEFSSLTLDHFPSNWLGFSCLSFNVLNPQSITVSLELKIHDDNHRESHYNYSDRYNELIRIKPGKNDVFINLDNVKTAPKRRNMDMANIDKLSLFTHNAERSYVLKFDDFELSEDAFCNR